MGTLITLKITAKVDVRSANSLRASGGKHVYHRGAAGAATCTRLFSSTASAECQDTCDVCDRCAQVLGTLITEWDAGAAMCRQLFGSAAAAARAAEQLAALARVGGFEGWLVNVENELPVECLPHVLAFLKYVPCAPGLAFLSDLPAFPGDIL